MSSHVVITKKDKEEMDAMRYIDGSVRHDNCYYQLTHWVETREEIAFAVEQVKKHYGLWRILFNKKKDMLALFVRRPITA